MFNFNIFALFSPENSFLLFWNTFLLIYHILVMINIPLYIIFQNTFTLLISKYIYFTLLLVDILIKLNTCYYKYGNLIKDRKKIIKFYLKKSFFIDFLIIVLDSLFESKYKLIKCVFLLKISLIVKLSEEIVQKFFLS